MSVIYFGKSQTPANVQVMATGAITTTTIWTPGSGKKISLTDLILSADNINAGTIRLYFYPGSDLTATPTMIFEQLYASGHIRANFDTPKINDNVNGVLRVVSSMSGNIWINMGGFEY